MFGSITKRVLPRCQARCFSTSKSAASHIGSAPISVTEDITCLVEPVESPKTIRKGTYQYKLTKNIVVKGPKGCLKLIVPEFVNVENVDSNIKVSVPDESNKIHRSMWGTVRSILQNNVVGVSEGHLTILKLVGTGYRAQLEEKDGKKYIAVKAGIPNLKYFEIPEGMEVKSPVPTRIIIEGADKQQVKLFAAQLRKCHPPEPYKGKGIYVDEETIKLKAKKIK